MIFLVVVASKMVASKMVAYGGWRRHLKLVGATTAAAATFPETTTGLLSWRGSF